MYLRMYAVYDLKAVAFLQPFFSNSNGSAIRAFEDVVNDGQSPIAKHPGDYQLFELAGFDDNTGSLVPLSPTKLLCSGSDFVKAVADVPVKAVWPQTGSVPAAVSGNGPNS